MAAFLLALTYTIVLVFSQNASTAAVRNGATPVVEALSYSNGSVTLSADLLVPAGDGPYPAVVIVHGSGSSARSNPWTAAYAQGLAARGIAVVHPDKRGSGSSSGEWPKASFLDLADDALAGVNAIGKHAKIDPRNIGVIGFSQGGHIAPAAAARSQQVAFVISISASVVPIVEQIDDELVLAAERDGLSKEQTETIRHIHALAVQYAQAPDAWGAYEGALRAAKEGPLAGKRLVMGFPTASDSPAWVFARSVGAYDPMAYWRQLKVPVVFVYGGKDENVRVEKSVGLIQESLKQLNAVILYFGGNGHSLYREDQLDFLASWILAKGKA